MASPSKPPSEQLLNNSHQTKVLKSAILSRLLLLILTLLWRTLLTPYDTSAPLNPACLNNPSPSPPPPPLLPSLASAIENGIVWDSVYFVRIAQCGYEYEQSYAFLPLLPACIFILSRTVFAPVVLLIGHRAVLALSGYVISNVAFIFAAIYFYRLSVIVLKDPNAALQASVLFCFNPASIFYSSIYSESLYALFSVGGLYYLKSRANNIAVFWLALSGFARSNGVLNAGYFGFQTMHQAYDAAFLKKRAFLALWILISGALRCICIFVPFITFQAYGYYNICLERSSDEMRPWCKARIPLLYNYIQICSIIYYVKSRPEIVLSLGFRASVEEKSSMAAIFSLKKSHRSNGPQISEKYSSRRQENHNLKLRKITSQGRGAAEFIIDHGSSEKLGYASASILPFILHLSFMVATAFFVMHVQVSFILFSLLP
ncbi:GPI mannosyltransferase 2 - like 1 [Theobroma cacao]|nr:GPI mannosyltransferase 2 - like 1 [Theobroma cacao]